MVLQILALEPPLIKAIFSGDHNEVRSILEEGNDEDGGDINYVDGDKRSPLHAAAYQGDPDIMEMLITVGGGRVNIKDNKWLTPLHRACAAKVILFCTFSVAKATLESQMSVCQSVRNKNPSASQNWSY